MRDEPVLPEASGDPPAVDPTANPTAEPDLQPDDRRESGGEEEAIFRELFGLGYSKLCLNAGAGIGPDLRRHLDADDIVQDAFLKAFELIDRIDLQDGAGLLVWLRRITEHKIQEKVRYWSTCKRSGAEELRPEADGTEERAEAAGDGAAGSARPGAAEQLGDREVLGVLFGVAGRMKPDQRDVILLRDFFEVSWAEIANILDRPTVGAAQQLHLRACTELRRTCGEEMD